MRLNRIIETPRLLLERQDAVRVGVSGARRIPPGGEEVIRRALGAVPDDAIVITGACIGVDAFVAREAHRSGRLLVVTVVPADRSRVDPDWRLWCHDYAEMPPGTNYRDRNIQIVAWSTRLLGFPMRAERDARSLRSGTWQTIRLAIRSLLPVEAHLLTEGQR